MLTHETLRVEHLYQQFGTTHALSDLNFSIEGPQLIGILGPNGAGKTSLLDILAGLTQPTQGRFYLFGTTGEKASNYPRRRVGVVLQREFIPEQMTVSEYAALFAAIYAIPEGQHKILQQAALLSRSKIPVASLSGGEAQRLFIAAVNVHEPELLLLDEPTAQLDPENKRQIGAFLCNLCATRTVIMTTHDLQEADAICNSVIFLVAGHIKAFGSRDAIIAATPNGHSLEDAFFYFCGTRVNAAGEIL